MNHILTVDLSLTTIQEVVSSINVLDTGYAFLLSKDHKILVHPELSNSIDTKLTKNIKLNSMIKDKENWIYYTKIKNTELILGIVFPRNELFASLDFLSLVSIILSITGALLLILTMIIISRKISRPLLELTVLTDAISKGDFERKITLPKSKDEVYHLSYAINSMQQSIKQYIKDLKDATIKQQKIESELEIAKSIQTSMLPDRFEASEGLSINAMLKPARVVGGDFYDYFYIDDDSLCFAVADVSGKGVAAAMFMSITMSHLRAYKDLKLSASELIYHLNNALAEKNDANMFVTIFLGILNTKSGELNYINAGHTEPLIASKSKKYSRLESLQNPVIGAFTDLVFEDEHIVLESTSRIFLYTDGVTESFSHDDRQYGFERLQEVLDSSIKNNYSCKSTIDAVHDDIQNFSHGCEQSDDITMMCLEFK